MDFSLSKSFKAQKHGAVRVTANGSSDVSHEELPILSEHVDELQILSPVDSPDRREVIVKVDEDGSSNTASSRNAGDEIRNVMQVGESDGGGSRLWRDSSYEFWREGDDGGFRFRQEADMQPKLIGHFLNNRGASAGNNTEMDLEMNEIREDGFTPTADTPVSYRSLGVNSKDLRVSFQAPATKEIMEDKASSSSSSSEGGSAARGYRNTPNGNGGSAEVLRCTSNASFQRKPSLMRMKTKSRLLDPPTEHAERRSGMVPNSGQLRSGQLKSGQLKSGISSKLAEDDEDDPFMEEDLPEGFKKEQLNAVAIIEWLSLLVIGGALICSLAVPLLRKRSLWELRLWKWEVLILVLICGRLVSGWGIRVIVFFIERNFLLRKRVLYFVYGLRKAVRNCLWLGQVLVAWHFLFDKKVERETNSKALMYVTKVLVCFLVACVLWLLKTLMVKVLASSFHVSTYFERIQDSLFNQYVIETLSGPPLVEMNMVEEEEQRTMAEFQRIQNAGIRIPPDLKASAFPHQEKSGRLIGSGGLEKAGRAKSIKFSRVMTKKADDGITVDHLQKLNHKNVSAWNMKRLMNIARRGVLSTLDERILDTTQDDEKSMQIRSEVEAKSAARQIFRNVARPGCKYIYPDDLMRFMPEDEALRTLSLFEGADERMRISKSCLKNWVVSAFRERRALALTLNDTKTAVNKLHQMVNVIVGIMIAVIWLIILEIASSKFFLVVSSQLVVAAFIFGNTLKTIFEAIIFLFVIHPFDVGDRCEIDGAQMVVEEMNILTTVFLRYDNLKVLYLNSVLATKAIHNFFRSPDMGDSVEFLVHIATPVEKIALMKQRIISYIESKSEHWNPSPTVILKDMDGLERLKFAVWLSHRMNHQDMGEKWIRRAQLVEEMVKIFRELDVQYRLYPMEINVRNMPLINSDRVPPGWSPSTS